MTTLKNRFPGQKNQLIRLDGAFDFATVRRAAKSLCEKSDSCILMDSHSHAASNIPITGVRFDLIAAAGIKDEFRTNDFSFNGLQDFIDKNKGEWIFGAISYDLKNSIENLSSNNTEEPKGPVLHFFVPEKIFTLRHGIVQCSDNLVNEWEALISQPEINQSEAVTETIVIDGISKSNYHNQVSEILKHILKGDIYELNFCQRIKAKFKTCDPLQLFRKVTSNAPNPFSVYYRNASFSVISASPERFLSSFNGRIISQPMKGTAPRSQDVEADKINKAGLRSSEKECSENVMIVDLVRNDLSRIAESGSVHVDELFGVHTFHASHQMISTVSCIPRTDIKFTDLLKATFPMGSMTGTPKVSAMQLIDAYENFRRGLFSGSIGYIDPESNFDFNVLIRCVLLDLDQKILVIPAGGAITINSNIENEFEEMLVKLRPQLRALDINENDIFSI